jgi:L-asparaginase
MNHKIAIIAAGGGIAARYDPLTGSILSAVSASELNIAVPQLSGIADIEFVDFSSMPSSYMDTAQMYKLAKLVDEIAMREDITGIVITHGTDTMEETAYFLDLSIYTEKVVCLTAAMRYADEISADGPKNLLAAVRTASCDGAQQRGVLVVMNEEIHSAREVTKTHSIHSKTFSSPFWGPLGYVDGDCVILRRTPLTMQKIFPKSLIDDVYLLKMVAGADDYLLRCLIKKPAAGIVIEGFGRGNIPPALVPAIHEAIDLNIPIVLTTRTTGGRVRKTDGYEGSAKALSSLGVVLAGEISGPKARIKLILALGAKCSHNDLVQLFSNP